ncbi:hypothetical protein BATDEDRAFT_30650 [Batrachochytrium dendrobatidis JAM81]|uniref:Geranylgeranyl transferase type-1 subunit beta n=2 Tax=Batrachochytrium dendrobatidis TaxID=109871 RepID=F4PAR5_BATDJ|nr:uncharacterized protein BATDEDRAFT_30650 [Batrachochytrium dendrobatidis JAM81]EGF77587.1 hypothetical protein BATDEDRAFT_30650 [Batrachochytrium dendrobatidis JAM81]|eukprot:XP_006681702.1 hypothetical protein BATDEDRAFT_30650 [Batrachochytrium dendrobatidis JAM81]
MTLGYFCVGGLDLLGKLETHISQHQRTAWIDWIYAQQIHPSEHFGPDSGVCGFRGSPFIGAKYDCAHAIHSGDISHITMTYTALALLLTLEDDLSRVDREAIIGSLARLQCEDGCFSPTLDSYEKDMRFLYCACAISFILSDWRGVNKIKAREYIMASRAFDYGYGQGPGHESHGGSTYCAIASLWLMNDLGDDVINKEKTIFWLLSRQETGFQGRINKAPDTCYSFWVGACLEMLGSYQQIVDVNALHEFLILTHSKHGGYSKIPKNYPDILHSYMGFAGLAISGKPGLGKLVSALGISQRSFDFWKNLGLKARS